MDPCQVLLVEDNESDEAQATRSIMRCGLNIQASVARDGEEACHMLENAPPYSLVLLDLKLPKVSGFQVLKQIRSQAATKNVPVIVLTSSGEPSDVKSALDLGANSYIQKQIDPDMSDSLLKLALYYWLVVDATSNPLVRMHCKRTCSQAPRNDTYAESNSEKNSGITA